MDLVLTLWVLNGEATHMIREPTSWADCRELYAIARYTDATGQQLHRDGAGLIVRLSCGGHDIVLALPASEGNCEVPSS